MKDVAVIIPSSIQYGRNLLTGISHYASLHGWKLHFDQSGLRTTEPRWLENWSGDGIIVHSVDRTISDKKSAKGIPVLDLYQQQLSEHRKGSIIDSDHHAVGQLAAEYFLGKEFTQFAYIGYHESVFSTFREQGYRDTLYEAGHTCAVYHTVERPQTGRRAQSKGLRDFLSSMSLPCALFCATDELAIRISNICQDLGIIIPEQLSLLGVDNDPLLCSMATPSLSSIDPDIPRMGWLAAKWLDTMMAGDHPEQLHIERTFLPKGITTRQSTSSVSVANPTLAKALEQIRLHACNGITIDEIATVCGVSRRMLERMFAKELDTTIKRVITDTQIKRIKELLLHTDYTLAHIAELTGMLYTERLSNMFKREVGVTPGSFRKNHSKQKD